MIQARPEQVIFGELAELCARPGFIHVVAHICCRDNMVKFSKEIGPDDMAVLYGSGRLVRSEISALICLMSRQDADTIGIDAKTLEAWVALAEALLAELHEAMTAPWAEAIRGRQDFDAAGTFLTSAAGMREPIFYGAESAYSFQYRDLARLKYAADNLWLERNKGFRIEDACVLAQRLGQLVSLNQSLIHSVAAEDPSRAPPLLHGFVFTLQDAVEASELPLETVRAVLAAFTLDDDAAIAAFNGLSAFNPVNAAPLLSAGEGKWVLLQPYGFFEAIYETPFFWMVADPAYRATAATHRGDFTEHFAAQRLAHVFGEHRVHRNVDIYRGKGKKLGEIDVLVLFGDRAIVLQAKSKRLTIEARNGNDLAMKADFKKAVQEAADQAQDCAEALLAGDLRFVDGQGQDLTPGALAAVYALCVVSDHYPALAFQAREFLTTRTTPGVHTPLTTDVFTLDAMSEMLDRPLRFLHYLTLRDRFGARLTVGHESALLGFHLKTNLWFEDEKADQIAICDQFSLELDIAMTARRDGAPGPKTPKGILTWFQDTPVAKLVQQIEASPETGSVELGLWLQQMGDQAHRDVSTALALIVTGARPGGPPRDVSVAVGQPASGLTIHCSVEPESEALQRLLGHCALAKHREKASLWYGLLLHPASGRIRATTVADFPWKPDRRLDALVAQIPRRQPPAALRQLGARASNIGRNEPCPCASGRKYKKCCGA